VQVFAQPEDAVRDGIAMVMVIEEPAIKLGLSQGLLNCVQLHICADSIPATAEILVERRCVPILFR
jgi:hypothetical protein